MAKQMWEEGDVKTMMKRSLAAAWADNCVSFARQPAVAEALSPLPTCSSGRRITPPGEKSNGWKTQLHRGPGEGLESESISFCVFGTEAALRQD